MDRDLSGRDMLGTMNSAEARLDDSGNVLILLSGPADERLTKDFCGLVIGDPSLELPDLSRKTVYLCGDLARAERLDLRAAARVRAIRGHSQGGGDALERVDPGQVPERVHGLGVYFRRLFDPGVDHFRAIAAEHAFQALTESNKPATAHRTGVYLTPVTREGEDLRFRLLRCSSNLSGPTRTFRAPDVRIVDALNREAGFLFENHAPLNHVLAQVYPNTAASAEQKQKKAKISAHADKTKDMPANGIMAFCTFYDRNATSGLTGLRFRLKAPVAGLPDQFTLTLHPDSAYLMPLSTNRLYTHEIVASSLDAALLPTRLGYVVRCSNREAVHRNGQTFLEREGELVPLEPPTPEGMTELRRLYAEENRTQAFIDYGDGFAFSMNQGDYLAPEC